MSQNKNQITTMTGTGVALKKASKSLKITNKLLSEADTFEKDWEWWLSLSDKWKERLIDPILWNYHQHYYYQLKLDLYDKKLMKPYILDLIALEKINLQALIYDDITDITPLSYLKNLIEVDLFHNEISDITPLKNLKNLKYLSLGICEWSEGTEGIHFNTVIDFNTLLGLFKIEKLYLAYTDFYNLDLLANLNNLNTLDLAYSKVSDFSQLENFFKIEQLNLSGNKLNENNLKFIGKMKNLRKLDLFGNNIVDIGQIDISLTIKYLNLAYNELTDISYLVRYAQLNTLILQKNQISNVFLLKKLKYLTYLDLSYNPIPKSDIDWLKKQLPNCNIFFA